MSGPPAPPDLEREAAHWFARMRGEEAEAHRGAFEAWLAADPAHRSAYSRAAEIFALGKLLGGDAPPPAPPLPAGPRPGRQSIAALAAVLLVALGAAAWIALKPTLPGTAPDGVAGAGVRDTLATGAGETRTVRLADGSTVRLGEGTRIMLRFDAAQRLLELAGGAARFEVAHAPRPFIVLAGGGRITARGTVFDVALRSDARVDVHLVEGAIDVALPLRRAADPPEPRRLRAGEQLSFAAQPRSAAAGPGPAASAGAADARRDYEAVAVAALVAEANRTAARPIRLADESLGRRRVSGRFRIDDSERLAERLAALFGWQVDRSDPREIVLR